jgi:hypothetical protein
MEASSACLLQVFCSCVLCVAFSLAWIDVSIALCENVYTKQRPKTAMTHVWNKVVRKTD